MKLVFFVILYYVSGKNLNISLFDTAIYDNFQEISKFHHYIQP